MKSLFRRIIGILLITAAIGGLIFSIFGIYSIWRYKAAAVESLTTSVEILSSTLDTTAAGLEVTLESLQGAVASLSALQGTLQTSLQDISTLLDAESQQRVRFEESVQQDMQGVADTISQLREVQAGLAEHIQRMQDSSQSQTGDILAALEQLQRKADVEMSAAEAQPTSSKASLQEITLP